MFIHYEEGKPTGYLTYNVQDEKLMIKDIYSEAVRKKVATNIMTATKKQAEEKGLKGLRDVAGKKEGKKFFGSLSYGKMNAKGEWEAILSPGMRRKH